MSKPKPKPKAKSAAPRPSPARRARGLRELRQDLGQTQEALAARADMTQGEVSRLERQADLRLSTLRRYAEALGVGLEVVFVLANGRRVPIHLG
ncbi:MAG: helix-turn-helix transcriptional regulator [Deltaproteobacteria bacterium]|jgi:transcriptional regulator with XRE-family HTH domain|nr:helix-turn-helix transcriptional regulator [Deltaproteobacteria bacterium]